MHSESPTVSESLPFLDASTSARLQSFRRPLPFSEKFDSPFSRAAPYSLGLQAEVLTLLPGRIISLIDFPVWDLLSPLLFLGPLFF